MHSKEHEKEGKELLRQLMTAHLKKELIDRIVEIFQEKQISISEEEKLLIAKYAEGLEVFPRYEFFDDFVDHLVKDSNVNKKVIREFLRVLYYLIGYKAVFITAKDEEKNEQFPTIFIISDKNTPQLIDHELQHAVDTYFAIRGKKQFPEQTSFSEYIDTPADKTRRHKLMFRLAMCPIIYSSAGIGALLAAMRDVYYNVGYIEILFVFVAVSFCLQILTEQQYKQLPDEKRANRRE